MGNIERAFGPWVIRNRVWILLVTALYMAIPVYCLKFVYFDSEYRNFIGDSLPSVIDMRFIEESFNRQDNILFVIAPEDGNIFSQETLSLIVEMTTLAWALPFSRRVDSITNYQNTRAELDDLFVNDLVEDPRSLTNEKIDHIRETALSEPRLKGHLVSVDGDVAGINVIFDIPTENSTEQINALVNEVTELVDVLGKSNPDVRFYVNGTIAQDHMVARIIQEDMETLVPIVMLLMTVILFLAIRNMIAVILTLLVVGLSIISAFGIGSYLGIHITPPVASSPTIILTIAIANCVHILVNFIHSLQQGHETKQAIIESLRLNLQPVSLACVTTMFGFLTLNLAETPPFRDLGNMVSLGVFSALLLSLFTLPACLSFIPIHTRHKEKANDRLMDALSGFVIRYQNRLLWITTAVLILSITAALTNIFNDNPLKYFKKSNPYRASTEFINQRLTGLTTLEFYLDSGEPGGINNPGFLRDVENFTDWLREHPKVEHVNSISDTLKRLNRSMHGDDNDYYVLPENRNLSAQYLLLYEMSLTYGLDLSNEINLDKSAIRLVINVETPDDLGFRNLQASALDWIDQNAGHITGARASSLFFAYSQVSVTSSKTLVFGTFLALSLISVLLMLAFRSYRVGLISFVSNLTPAIAGFGVWGLVVGEIGGGTSIVAAVTIGIVVDDTVHILSKYQRIRRETNTTPEDAIIYALRTVGRALIITTVVLITGFLVLLFSDFRLNFEMGTLTSIVLVCALATVFLLAPPLMMKFLRK